MAKSNKSGVSRRIFRGTHKSNATVFRAAKEDLGNPGNVPAGLFNDKRVI